MKVKKTITIKSISVGIICILLCSMILTTVASGEHINKLQQSQTLEYKEPISSETVDIKIQLSGSPDNEVSVTLTQEQAAQFEQRIQLFKEQLEQSQTDKQTTQVFIDMIHYLDAQNMLPSHLSVQQAIQQVLAFNHQNKQMGSLLQQIDPNTVLNEEYDNDFCLVAGRSTVTFIVPLFVPRIFKMMIFNLQYGGRFLLKDSIRSGFFELQKIINMFINGIKNGNYSTFEIVQGIVALLIGIFVYAPFLITALATLSFLAFKPLTIASNIGYGIKVPHGPGRARGWLHTIGKQGIKSLDGAFYGFTFGFSGIKIYTPDSEQFFYFGSALAVRID